MTKTVRLVGAFPEGWTAKADIYRTPGGQLTAQLTIQQLGTIVHTSDLSDLGASEKLALATLSLEALVWIKLFESGAGQGGTG